MKYISRADLPDDHYYHRTASSTYRKYLEDCWLTAITFPQTPQFWWVKNLLGKFVKIIKYERIDIEPDMDFLKSTHGFEHDICIWVPWRRKEIPSGWRKLWVSSHFQENGFTILDNEDYTKKWNERAKRARKKFLASWAIIREVDAETFSLAFKNTRVKHLYKNDYIKYYKHMAWIDPTSVRSLLCYVNGSVVAWLAVHDYCNNSSVHLVAFTGKEWYPIQAWTGLIDYWFLDSWKKQIRYMNFDQLRNKYGPSDQKWYTAFKENFIEFRVTYPDSYFKMQ